jgi:hypothetical protein
MTLHLDFGTTATVSKLTVYCKLNKSLISYGNNTKKEEQKGFTKGVTVFKKML